MNAPSEPAAPAGRPVVATAALVVLAAVGLSATGFVADAAHDDRVPTPAALSAAVDAVRAGHHEGDAVVVRPAWFGDTLWNALTTKGPATAPVPAAALMRGDRLDPLELLRHGRVWVIAAFDAPAQPDADWLDPLEVVASQALGAGVNVTTLTLPELDHRGRLTRDLARLKVSRHAAGAPRAKPCRWRGREHECGKQGWLNPRIEREDVFHRDVDWLFAVPGPGSTALYVDWALPKGETLVVRAGFSLTAVRNEAGSPVRVTVRLGEEIVDDFVLPPHRYTEARRLVPLPAATGARPRTVRFEVRATDHDYRHLLLQADVLGAPSPAVQRWVDAAPPL